MDLLTTGVDVPGVRNIAFFRYMKSPISFYQMIGRGTRIDEPTGKLMFTVYDYTGATRLSACLSSRPRRGRTAPPKEATAPVQPPPPPRPSSSTASRFSEHLGQFVVASVDGQAMPVPIDDYKAGLSARLTAECPTLEDFRARWVNPPDREEMIERSSARATRPACCACSKT